ncbi:hypothetical protein [Mitsuokella multacida]|uniref:hypothetical protein n=1 Tax=Mitsuokella multacida TaxID=52226 RepID=UPI0026667D06|nr:hypothetical protein [Mitsuokella multacida]
MESIGQFHCAWIVILYPNAIGFSFIRKSTFDIFRIYYSHISFISGSSRSDFQDCPIVAVLHIKIIIYRLTFLRYGQRHYPCRLSIGHACPRKRSQGGEDDCGHGSLLCAAARVLTVAAGEL